MQGQEIALVAPRGYRRCSRARRCAGHSPRVRAAGRRRLTAACRALREGQAGRRGDDLGTGRAIDQWIPAEFAKRFPAVKVNWLGDQQASSRLIAEKRAGRHDVDVWTFSLGGTLEVQKRGLLEKFDWRQYGAQDRDIFWDSEAVANHNYVYAPIFTKSKLTKEQGPRAWGRPARPAMERQAGLLDSFLPPRLGGYFGDRLEVRQD